MSKPLHSEMEEKVLILHLLTVNYDNVRRLSFDLLKKFDKKRLA